MECPPNELCSTTDLGVEVDLSGWSLRATGAYPIGARFTAFASLGVLVWDADSTFIVPGFVSLPVIPSEGDAFLYEVGLRFQLTDQWSMEASWEKAELDVESSELGVLFRF